MTAIAILAAAIVTVLPLFEQFIIKQSLDERESGIIFDDYLKEKIFLTLVVFNVIGLIVISLVNLTSAAVIKQITSLKSNILLAVRQLNCNREAIQDAIAANLCGFYPIRNWRESEKGKWSLADAIYIRHNKFPIDNDGLRKFYVRRHRNILIRLICFILWPLRRYREKCSDDKCENNINIKRKGNLAKCYKIRLTNDGEFNHYVFNKYGDIEIEENTKLPKLLPLRVLLFGYRAAYIRSPDLMSILAMIIVTTMVALLVPAGNFYIWFRINLIPSADEYTKISEIWNYIWIFSFIDILIILMFVIHFKDIINYSMANIVNLLKPNKEM